MYSMVVQYNLHKEINALSELTYLKNIIMKCNNMFKFVEIFKSAIRGQ